MSLAELKAEIAQLTPEQLAALRLEIDGELKKKATLPVDMTEYLGCTRGMMQFKPGWDDPEPLEDWNALRGDTPL